MSVSYADAHDLLGRLVLARSRYDGDRLVEEFGDACEVVLDPFEPALVGHNALRAYLNDAALAERWFDLAIERHWVSGSSVLAAWHASWTRIADEAKVRQAGFLSAEMGEDGRIARLRLWTVSREHLAG
jgi:hypothetical protein